MAFCTMCGAIFNDEDIHICIDEDIPKKGEIKRNVQTIQKIN